MARNLNCNCGKKSSQQPSKVGKRKYNKKNGGGPKTCQCKPCPYCQGKGVLTGRVQKQKKKRPITSFAAFFVYVAKRAREMGVVQQSKETMRQAADCWRKLKPEQKRNFQMAIMPGIIKELDDQKSKDSKSAPSPRPPQPPRPPCSSLSFNLTDSMLPFKSNPSSSRISLRACIFPVETVKTGSSTASLSNRSELSQSPSQSFCYNSLTKNGFGIPLSPKTFPVMTVTQLKALPVSPPSNESQSPTKQTSSSSYWIRNGFGIPLSPKLYPVMKPRLHE